MRLTANSETVGGAEAARALSAVPADGRRATLAAMLRSFGAACLAAVVFNSCACQSSGLQAVLGGRLRHLPNGTQFPGLHVIGGSQESRRAAAAPQRKATSLAAVNYPVQASAFFGSIRTPATLIVGSALASLWLPRDDEAGNVGIARATFSYLMAGTVALELSTVFVSTAANTRLLAGGFPEEIVCGSVVEWMITYFELPYVAARLSFQTGLLLFLAGLIARVNMFYAKDINLRRAIQLLLLSTAFHSIAFFQSTLIHYDRSYFSLFARYLRLKFSKYHVNSLLRNPLDLVSWISGIASIAVFIRCVRNNLQQR